MKTEIPDSGGLPDGAQAAANVARGNEKEAIMRLLTVLICTLLVTLGGVTVAQQSKEMSISVPSTPASSGKQMFEAYCASCHGKEGKGDGPAAAALKVPPADLTTLTARNNGKFPALKVSNTIVGQSGTPAHGSKEMPIWGPVFTSISHQHESEMRLRVANLTDYIKSLQSK